MSITKKPTKPAQDATAAAAEAFISGAPDAAAAATPQAPRRVRKGRKVQITLTIAEPMLDRVDELARQIGQSRAAVINLAVMQMLQRGLHIGGE
jgi:gamma-glutamyl:cysteine ligase YbdK (ATP-grasp superfamily)